MKILAFIALATSLLAAETRYRRIQCHISGSPMSSVTVDCGNFVEHQVFTNKTLIVVSNICRSRDKVIVRGIKNEFKLINRVHTTSIPGASGMSFEPDLATTNGIIILEPKF